MSDRKTFLRFDQVDWDYVEDYNELDDFAYDEIESLKSYNPYE